MEALPYVYKEDVFELVAEKIYTRDLEPELAVPVLRGLALTTDVTEKMCNDISVRNKLTCLLILRAPTFGKCLSSTVIFHVLL